MLKLGVFGDVQLLHYLRIVPFFFIGIFGDYILFYIVRIYSLDSV